MYVSTGATLTTNVVCRFDADGEPSQIWFTVGIKSENNELQASTGPPRDRVRASLSALVSTFSIGATCLLGDEYFFTSSNEDWIARTNIADRSMIDLQTM